MMKQFSFDFRFQRNRLRLFLTNPKYRRYHLRKRNPLRKLLTYLTSEISKNQYNTLFQEQPETEYIGEKIFLSEDEDPSAALGYFRVMSALAQTDAQFKHASDRVNACLDAISINSKLSTNV